MHTNFLMRSMLSVLSAALGGFGVFLAAYSFSTPGLGMHALLFLGAAAAIAYWLDA